MKIALFSDTYIPDINGVATSTNILRNKLVNLGHDVLVVTSELPSDTTYDESLDDQVLRVPGLEIQALYGYRACNIFSFKGMKEIKRFNPEVIHVQTEFGIGYFSRIVAKKLNLPIVHTYHTLYEDYIHYVTHGHFNNLAKKLAIKITKYYCEKKCDELIVPTDKIKDLFINKYNISQPINVIPTGIDIDKFKLTQNIKKEIENIKKKYKIKDTDFIIGSVGRIAPEKSFDKLLYNISKCYI